MTYQDDRVTVLHGDCLGVLRADELGYDYRLGYAAPKIPDCSVDAVVTDPPYGLANTDPAHVAQTITRWVNGERDYLPGGAGFMGKAWDAFVPPVAVWDECLRVLKPGGHVLCFAGSRTVDLMTLGLRLAGFDIRDSIAWLYGSGFPKSLDVGKAIDKAAGAERRVLGRAAGAASSRTASLGVYAPEYDHTEPATPDAERWQGWGTALKPAFEPVIVARKPLAGTVAANVLQHGTGALNIDGCRVHTPGSEAKAYTVKRMKPGATLERTGGNWRPEAGDDLPWEEGREYEGQTKAGRWPTNVALDDRQAAELDEQSGERPAGGKVTGNQRSRTGQSGIYGEYGAVENSPYNDTGGASRFFPTFRYEEKAPTAERPRVGGVAHPTVKPLDLMRWLVRLVTPPGGKVLDPFAGSGTTGEACVVEGFECVLVEREDDYLPLIRQRVNRRRDPVAYIADAGDDLGLFGIDEATA